MFLLLTAAWAGPLDLPDVHGEVHAVASWWVDGAVVVAGAQRASPEAMEAWRAALPQTRVVIVTDLSGVPFFVPKAAVRSSLAGTFPADTLVLCDWTGEGYAALGLTPGALVEVGRLDAGGVVTPLASGPVDAAAAARIRAGRPAGATEPR